MKITKDELEKMYRENSNDKLCEILGITKVTLIKYLTDAGIELKGKGGGLAKKKIQVV